MISQDLLDILACPASDERPPVRLCEDEQSLVCDRCGRHYPIRDDIPVMLVEEAVQRPIRVESETGPGTA